MTSMSADQVLLEVSDPSAVAEVRRVAGRLVNRTEFSPAEEGNLALIATELASNILKHAQRGSITLSALRLQEQSGIELTAVDRGPGIRNLAQALSDGYSTAGTPGTGLGAVKRLASEFDIYSVPNQGTAVLARLWSREQGMKAEMEFGAVCLPKPGEEISGDQWGIETPAGRIVCTVADGLGHGTEAAKAAQAAVAVARQHRGKPPSEIVERAHGALRSTRGAALAVGEIDPANKLVRFCGIGNISARIVDSAGCRHLVSHNGTVGQVAGKIGEFTYPWHPDCTLIMYSDGLTSRWDFRPYPALIRRHPALIASVLFRDHARGNDDTTVLIAREGNNPPA